MKIESGIGTMIASLALAVNLGCGTDNSKQNVISLHCSPSHTQPLSAINRSRHLDVEIYPVTDRLRRSADLTVVIVGYRFTIYRFLKEIVPVHDQNPNATRITHLPPSLSVTLGDRAEVILGALTENQINDRHGIYIASTPITAGTMSCSHA